MCLFGFVVVFVFVFLFFCVCLFVLGFSFVCSKDSVFFYAFLKEKITFDLHLVTLSESSTYALMSLVS